MKSENGELRNKRVLISLCVLYFILSFIGCKQQDIVWKQGVPFPKENLKIAVIHFTNINQGSFYENAHYEGTVQMQSNIGLENSQIIRRFNVFDNDPGVVEGIMRDCIADGVNVIIATTFGYMNVCEKLALEFPSVIFLHAYGFKYNNYNFANFSTRLYQARYLSGIVAGLNTNTNRIGYVAAMGKSSSEVTGGINAFALGVELVNPEARIYVRVTHSWFDPMEEDIAANALIAMGCDIIAAHSDTSQPQTAAQLAGVLSIGIHVDMNTIVPNMVITSVVPNWGIVYTSFIESIIDGTFQGGSYLYGLGEGWIDITPINTRHAVSGTEAATESARRRIMYEGFNVFEGILETNDGRTVGEPGRKLSDDVILSGINWYYRNVIEL